MEQNEWFSPANKSDSATYYDLNEMTEDKFNEQDLMNQIDPSIYDQQPNNFNLDYNFEMPDLDQNLDYNHNNSEKPKGHHHNSSTNSSHTMHNSSTAYPPTDIIENTPLIIPNKSHLTNGTIMNSPILPSQNDKSFNNQHYYHKAQRNKSKELFEINPNQQHIRPDAVFTPLVSPSNTPLDRKYSNPIQTTFEPLTSPALSAQDTNNGHSKRRPSSSTFAPVDENKPTSYKRRTPHGTPILASNKKSPGSMTSITNFEKLPDSSIANQSNYSNFNSDSNSNSDSNTPMLPPQSKKLDNSSTTTSPQLMSFTMGKLAKQESHSSIHHASSHSLNDISPTLKSRTSSMSKSSDNSPNLGASKSKEKPTTKKASHKLAEQGRRNRMNLAVHSLGSLIPQNYHDQVTIPSKATTVELAAKYIKDLLDEVHELKSQHI